MAISYRAAQNLIKRGDEEGFADALDAKLNPNLANPNGWTLMMLAAVEGNVAMAEALLARGASTNNRNSKGETALVIAEARGHEAFAGFLREHGAS